MIAKNSLAKYTTNIAFALLLFAPGSTLSAPHDWSIVWSDEFASPTIDPSKWTFDTGNGAPDLTGWGNNELEYYTSRSENARIENDRLIIEVHKENYRNCSYTSARLKTFRKGDWTYGRFEVRAKLPKGKGIWPAIWLLPTDNVYGSWAASGEIDIMEYLGQNTSKVYGTIHYGGEWPNNTSSSDSMVLTGGDFSDDFHIFSLEWDSSGMRWYVDSTCFETQFHGQPFDKRFFLLLNVAVGGNWPGAPNSSTIFPQIMEIDYVRVYQKVISSRISQCAPDHPGSAPTVAKSFDLLGRAAAASPVIRQIITNNHQKWITPGYQFPSENAGIR